MRPQILIPLLLAAIAVAAALAAARGKDDPGEAALKKAVERGKALFHDKTLGTKERACATCHANPDKPKLHLPERVDYPKYDRRGRRVVTLGWKINQMIERNLKGETRELGSDDLVAIEAYRRSISRDR